MLRSYMLARKIDKCGDLYIDSLRYTHNNCRCEVHYSVNRATGLYSVWRSNKYGSLCLVDSGLTAVDLEFSLSILRG